MNILYFSFVELDIPNACQTHTLGVLEGFSNNLCNVDAVIPRPQKVHPKIPGIRFYYLWPWSYTSFGKQLVKILGGIFFFGLCLQKKYDAIYVRELEANPFPRWCSKVFHIPLYIEVNGIMLQSIKSSGSTKRRLLKAERCQSADFRQAAGIIVPSYPRLRWIIDYYNLEHNKIHMILNGADTSLSKKTKRSEAARKLNLPEDGFYLGYLGSVWHYYDLECIMDAVKLCQTKIPNLHLLIIGGGPEMERLQSRTQEMQLDEAMVFCGFIQPERLFETIGVVDVGLMNLTQKGLQDLGPVTTRFATYAAFQLPVIANSPYMEYYPHELTEGLSLVPCEDPQALAQMIVRLYNHPEERKTKSKILHDFVVTNLTWTSVSKQIMEIICRDKQKNRYRKNGI